MQRERGGHVAEQQFVNAEVQVQEIFPSVSNQGDYVRAGDRRSEVRAIHTARRFRCKRSSQGVLPSEDEKGEKRERPSLPLRRAGQSSWSASHLIIRRWWSRHAHGRAAFASTVAGASQVVVFKNDALACAELEIKAAGVLERAIALHNLDFTKLAEATGLFGMTLATAYAVFTYRHFTGKVD
jgi:hypothetical protein